MKHFSELSLSPVLQANLSRNKLTTPTPVQAQAIPAQLDGRDVVVTAQTGTGKTLAFMLPLLEQMLAEAPAEQKPGTRQNIQALILSPTRELAIQIDATFRMLAEGTRIRSAVVTGGANEQRQLLAIRQGAQIVIATPGRLQDFLQRKLVRLETTRFLVLDEADRMLDMGFLPVIKQILAALPTERQTMFFSATMEPEAARLIKNYLREPVRVEIGVTGKPAEHVDLHLYEVESDRKLGLLQKMLDEETGSFLVFARTKHGADRLAKKLATAGANATRIHGNRTQSQRNQALRGFQEGDYRVLVATDVAARGIHVDGIAHVVNFDLPQVPEDFVHRVGRTGRAGIRGTATTFALRAERGEISKIERLMGVKLQRRAVTDDVVRESREARQRDTAHRDLPPRDTPFYKGRPGDHSSSETKASQTMLSPTMRGESRHRPNRAEQYSAKASGEQPQRDAQRPTSFAKRPAEYGRHQAAPAKHAAAHSQSQPPRYAALKELIESEGFGRESRQTNRSSEEHRPAFKRDGFRPARSFDGKPFERKSFQGKPDEGKSGEGKSSHGKPFSAKPSGSKPFGDKPFNAKAGDRKMKPSGKPGERHIERPAAEHANRSRPAASGFGAKGASAGRGPAKFRGAKPGARKFGSAPPVRSRG